MWSNASLLSPVSSNKVSHSCSACSHFCWCSAISALAFKASWKSSCPWLSNDFSVVISSSGMPSSRGDFKCFCNISRAIATWSLVNCCASCSACTCSCSCCVVLWVVVSASVICCCIVFAVVSVCCSCWLSLSISTSCCSCWFLSCSIAALYFSKEHYFLKSHLNQN